jgi:hypothetical protein
VKCNRQNEKRKRAKEREREKKEMMKNDMMTTKD